MKKLFAKIPIVLFAVLTSGLSLEAKEQNKIFNHRITLDLADNTNTPLNKPFELPLTIEVIGHSVSVHMKSFNFKLPKDGYIYTKSGFLPQRIWPGDVVPQAFSLKSDQTGLGYDIYVTNAGSLLIYDTGGGFLPAGNYTTHATTITYLLTDRTQGTAPDNLLLSEGTSNAVILGFPFDFLEFYDNSIVNNRFAVCWPDNAKVNSPNGRQHLNIIVRTGKIIDKDEKKIKLNEPVIALKAPHEKFEFLESSVIINPLNPKHLFLISLAGDFAVTPFIRELWRAVSLDGGKTWDTARLDGTFGLPTVPDDGVLPVFDEFGNLWVAYLHAPNPENVLNPLNLVYAVSTDGGFTFKKVADISPAAHPDFALNIFDYARASFGGDGKGGKALWVSFTYYFDDPSSPYGYASEGQISYIPVQGKGKFGSLVHEPIPQTSFPPFPGTVGYEIVASPKGKIYLVGESFDTYFNSNHLHLYVNPKGAVNLGPNSFTGRRDIAFSNVSKTDTVIPFQPGRNIDCKSYGIAFDPTQKRLFVGIVDMQPDFSNNMTLNLLHTDDDGLTWSVPRPIANRVTEARGKLNMSRDPFTGNLLFSWFDSRGQKDQANVNIFMAIMTKKELDKDIITRKNHSKVDKKYKKKDRKD